MKNKKRWVAILLNLVMGAGYLYIGKTKKAIYFTVVPHILILCGFYLESYLTFSFPLAIVASYLLWLYSFVDIWKYFYTLSAPVTKYSSWYNVLFFIIASSLLLDFLDRSIMELAPVRTYISPSNSMSGTIKSGDHLVAIETKNIKRGDVVVFHWPTNPKTMLIKRVIASQGDEIIYQEKKLFIHFAEGDNFIKKTYSDRKLKVMKGKLWVENPYMKKHKGIHYKPKRYSSFQALIQRPSDMQKIDISEPVSGSSNSSNKRPTYSLYKKVEKGSYYLLGDDRDNSNDSRFWGSVDKKYIFGIAKIVYINWKGLNRFGIKIK